MQSHKRGKSCLSSSMCIKLKASQRQGPSNGGQDLDVPQFPNSYTRADNDDTVEGTDVLYPPASADETQYNILKFYDFTSNVEFSILEVRGWILSLSISVSLQLSLFLSRSHFFSVCMKVYALNVC